MKRKYLIYLLALLMAFSPAAVFAESLGTAPDADAPVEDALDEAEPAADDTAGTEEAAPEADAEQAEEAVPAEEVAAEDFEAIEGQEAKFEGKETGEAGEDPAVIINDDPQPLRGTWNASHTQFTIEGKTSLAGGLFKAPKKNGEGMVGLFYADRAGNVSPEVGTVKVDNSPIYYSYDAKQNGFEKDSSLSKSVTYYQTYDKDYQCYCMTAVEGLYDDPITKTKIYLDSKGIVKTTAGYIDFGGSKYYAQAGGAVLMTAGFTPDHKYFIPAADGKICTAQGTFSYNGKTWYSGAGGVIPTVAGLYSWNGSQYYVYADGSVKTTAGFVNVNGKTYLAVAGGAIRTTAGPVSYGGKMYVTESGGAIRTTTGFFNASGNLYYIENGSGVVAVNEAFKVGGKKYHAMSNGVIAVGAHKWGKYYYFSSTNGALRTKTGVVKYAGKYYHVKKGGKITTNKKVKYKKKYYIASKTGIIYTRIFTWKKNLYYASGKGVLRTKAGFITYDDKKYYVRKGGKIYKNKLFKVGGKKYLALSDGHIGTGLYIWKSKRYITNAKGAIIAKEGLYSYNGKTYYVKSSGVIPSNTFDTYKEKHYYSGSDGAIVKSAFSYKGITIHPNSQTGEISMEDYVKVFPNAAPKEVDG